MSGLPFIGVIVNVIVQAISVHVHLSQDDVTLINVVPFFWRHVFYVLINRLAKLIVQKQGGNGRVLVIQEIAEGIKVNAPIQPAHVNIVVSTVGKTEDGTVLVAHRFGWIVLRDLQNMTLVKKGEGHVFYHVATIEIKYVKR